MNGNCYDSGTIQAFLDGQTAPDVTACVTDHIAGCDSCAVRLAQAEEENSLVFSALDREFNTLVPTQRLWARINDSIATEKNRFSVRQRLFGAISACFSSPTLAGLGAAAVIAIVFTGFALRQNGLPAGDGQVAEVYSPVPPSVTLPGPTASLVAPSEANPRTASPIETAAVKESRMSAIKVRNGVNAAGYGARKAESVIRPVQAAYLPGEDGYIKTIADLKQSVDDRKDIILSPSNRIAYERDMAVVNDSISRMQKVVRANPRNQAAKQILYSAYQDKIDLLNSVAQREELMASLR